MFIAIVDDEKKDREQLSAMLQELSNETGIPVQTEQFSTGESFLAAARETSYDVVFMDIYLNSSQEDGRDGISISRKLRKSDTRSALVFLTSSEDHYAQAFSLHAFDYLTKPVSYDALEQLFHDLELYVFMAEPTLTIGQSNSSFEIPYSKILYIISDANYVRLQTDQEYRFRGTFTQLSDQLQSDPRFLTINRGVLINMDHVRVMDHKVCTMENGMSLPLNRRQAAELKRTYIQYQFDKRTSTLTGDTGKGF